MTLVWSINGTDLASENIICDRATAWQASPVITRASVGVSGMFRRYRSRITVTQDRPFSLPLYGPVNTLTDRVTGLDWIKQWLDQDILLQAADGTTTRQLLGTVVSVPAEPNLTANNTTWSGNLVLQADCLWQATSTSTIGSIQGTPVSVPLGTAPTEDASLAITVSGGSDPRTITVTIGGTVSYVTVWTGSISTNTLTLDFGLCSVLNNTTPAVAGLIGGFPAMMPKNGPCTITVTSSSGTATGVLTYRKKYF